MGRAAPYRHDRIGHRTGVHEERGWRHRGHTDRHDAAEGNKDRHAVQTLHASSQRFPNSWNAMFTLITARDSGVPPYSRSVSSSSFVKMENFCLSSAATSSAVFCPMPVFAASTSARLNCT